MRSSVGHAARVSGRGGHAGCVSHDKGIPGDTMIRATLLGLVRGVSLIGCAMMFRLQAADKPPVTPASEDLAEGQALFRGLCSGCHGGAGRGGKGPDLTDDKWIHGDKDEDIARVIREGVPKTTMKKLGESLKEEQIQKLILYIRSLHRSPEETGWKPYLAGDPISGKKLF